MNKDSPYYEAFVKFQQEILDYFEETWINGNYDPDIWPIAWLPGLNYNLNCSMNDIWSWMNSHKSKLWNETF